MQILLVTEEELLAELIAFRLELLGHSVETRTTADQMMRSLQDSEFSLLIVDTRLPDANTRDSLTKVRSCWSKESLPILVISMDQSLELVELAFRCGADDYLLAPFDPQAMQSKLEKLISGRPLVSSRS
jgi:DNA-binding response OmpR family regulator